MSIWGKIIGATAGFALGGPIGAMLGIMVGGSFDRNSKNFKKSNQITDKQKQQIFALSIIILSAKIAKADGKVTKDEIYTFKDKFSILDKDMFEVGKIFNEAKKTKDGFKEIADQVGLVFLDNKILLQELLNNLFYIAESDGNISTSEIEILKSISSSFGLSDKIFQRLYHAHLNNLESDPYKILSISRKDDDLTIRKRWIALSKEHHPDNLIAKGLPKEFIKQSNNELSKINLAYDKIKKQREIN